MIDIKKYFSVIIILALVIIILLQRSCKGNSAINTPTIETKIDTIWKVKHDTITNNVKVDHVIHVPVPADPQYQPSQNIDTCNARFNKVLKDMLFQTVYKDTLKLDSLGTITIIDTVFMNKLLKRIKIYDYKIPVVTKIVTITKHDEPKRQLYIGGNMFGDRSKIQLVTPGILYKTKQDHIYQVNIGINFDGSITYGLGAYWKIKLTNK
jgi:hypothetical protein